MSDSVPSLLTQTQRERVRSGFENVESAKRRRDQRKIRSRIVAGLDDFEVLSEYPNEQFETAFADTSEEELQARLADAYLTIERIRTLHDINRDEMIETAREREETIPDDTTKLVTESTFRTHDDWRRHLEEEIADEYRLGRWKWISDTFLKIGFALLIAVSLLAVIVPQFTNGPGSIIGIAGAVFVFCGLVILGIRSVKYDLIPIFRRLQDDPWQTLRIGWNRF